MKVLTLVFFLILSFSQGLNAKEACGLQEPGFFHWAEKFVDGAKEFGLTLLGGAEAKAVWFCEDPDNPKTCHERAVFDRHRVKDREIRKITAGFAGKIEGLRFSNDPVGGQRESFLISGSAFLFETEKCPRGRFVITNAHFKYNDEGEKVKFAPKETRFCLYPLSNKKRSCYPVDIREKNILIGKLLDVGDVWEDYLVAPLMRKKGQLPSSQVVPNLVTLDAEKSKEFKSGKGLYYSGYYSTEKRMYSGTGCKIPWYGAINNDSPNQEHVLYHSCPTLDGFSGTPLFYFDDKGKPKAFGVHVGNPSHNVSGSKYDLTAGYSNYGPGFSPDLIKKINAYCEEYLKRKQ